MAKWRLPLLRAPVAFTRSNLRMTSCRSNTAVSSATFTGLVSSMSNVGQVRVEIYRVFPESSDTRTRNDFPVNETFFHRL